LDNDLWHEYRAHLGDERSKGIVEERRRKKREFSTILRNLNRARSERQTEHEGNLRERIGEWIKFNKVEHNPPISHLYLTGKQLDSLLEALIPYSSSEIHVVNPYVEKCTLSNLLVDASNSGREVKLITQSPTKDYEGKRKEAKIRFHETMKQSGVKMYYNESIHAKMFLLDKEVLALGSMNLYSDSTAGKLWEAGMFTVDNVSIKSASESFNQLEKNIESVLQHT
jgi:phosphatidylserine/phosphatidylglycerophosphate/cardiolipin synthase-like enzyme